MSRSKRSDRSLGTLGLMLALSCQAHGAVLFRTVALSGQQPPGTPSGTKFSTFAFASLDGNDRAGFVAYLETGSGGVDATNFTGIWSDASLQAGDPAELHLVARQNDQAPDTPTGAKFTSLTQIVMDKSGRIAFTADLLAGSGGVTTSNRTGVWAQRTGTPALIARTGDQAPGTPAGAKFSRPVSAAMINGAGQGAFIARLLTGTGGVDASNDQGIWTEGSGTLSLVARKGDQAPGTPAGANFEAFDSFTINDAGRITCKASLHTSQGGVDATNRVGIWSEGSGALTLVARSADQAPGAPAGENFAFFSPPAIDGAGHTVFRADLGTGADSVAFTDAGIWSDRTGVLSLVARNGDPAPGATDGATFSAFPNSPVVNAAGHIAFSATLDRAFGTNGGLWSDATGTLTLVARLRDSAPGTELGTHFDAFDTQPVINGPGRIAFKATLAGPSVIANVNDVGIWAQSASGGLKLVVRTGDTVEVAPGDMRTLAFLSPLTVGTFGEQGGGRTFSDTDRIIFMANFTDNSYGVFVAEVPGTDTDANADADGDGVIDASDNCPKVANTDQVDADHDGVGDACDTNPTVSNPDQPDANPNTVTAAQSEQVGSSGTGTGTGAQSEQVGGSDTQAPSSVGRGAGSCGLGTAMMTALTAPFILFMRRRVR